MTKALPSHLLKLKWLNLKLHGAIKDLIGIESIPETLIALEMTNLREVDLWIIDQWYDKVRHCGLDQLEQVH